MHDMLTRPNDEQHHQPVLRRTPRPVTTVLCLLATAKCIHVIWLLSQGTNPALTRSEVASIAFAAAVAFPALYLLARDLMGCPRAREAVSAFRIGVAVGKMRRR